MAKLLQNRYVQLALALFVGITLGAVFYPTKTIERSVEQKLEEEHSTRVENLRKEHREELKELSDRLTVQEAERRELQEETKRRISRLTTENRKLKESSKKQRFKLIKPDGTIIEKELEESNREETSRIVTQVREEFDRKVKSIEDRWKKAYRERLEKVKTQQSQEIAELKAEHRKQLTELKIEEKTTVNPKKLNIEAGLTTDREYHLHGSYTLWGPMSVGVGTAFSEEEFDHATFGLGINL